MDEHMIVLVKLFKIHRSFCGTGLSSLVVTEGLLLKDVEVVAVTFGKSNGGLLVADDEEVAGSGGKGLSVVILQVDDVVASEMLLDVQDLSDSADVVSSSDVGEVSRLVLVELNNGVLLKVELDGVSLRDLGIGEADGAGVVSDDVGFLVGTNNTSANLEKLGLGLVTFLLDEGEATLDVVEETEALTSLGEGDNVHDADGELDVASDSVVDLDAGFLILDDDVGFAAVEGDLEVVSAWLMEYLRMMERGRHSLSLWGPWLGLLE